jgi:hypothetical protein
LYSGLENIPAYYSFGSVTYFNERTTENCENQNNSEGI